MSIEEDKIARLRGLAGQVENAMALGLVDDVGDPELVEVVALLRELDEAGCLRAPVALEHAALHGFWPVHGGWATRVAIVNDEGVVAGGSFNSSGAGWEHARGILVISPDAGILREIAQVLSTAADQIDERS